ncbi:MAG: hypothetical protein U0234_27690 [Sandaracinus sp.]
MRASPRSPRRFLLTLLASLALLGLLCACGVIPSPFERPPPPTPMPVAPPPPTPIAMPIPIPTSIPGLPPGIPTTLPSGLPIPTTIPGLPSGLPSGLPTSLPSPGDSLLSHDPPPDYATLAPAPPGSTDASGAMTMPFLRTEVTSVIDEVRSHLPPEHRARVEHVPFHIVDDPVEPNAAAGCAPASRAPMIMITTPMLVICAATAEARAYDELAGTNTYETYASSILDMIRRGSIRGLAPGQASGPLATDPRKLARQRQLFDEQVAFILGHEMAHHYRGHTGCAPGGAASAAQAEALQRELADTAPPLEQPFEVEADMWGITSVLEAGHERAGGHWSDEGALLSLDTFRHLGEMTTDSLPLVFLSTHPPSLVRAPIVEQVARSWTPGRAPLPEPTVDGQGIAIDLGGGTPIHIPIPGR